MPKTQPDAILHLPQTQLQGAQSRLTDHLTQVQYAFMQSFTGHGKTIFDIFSPALPEGVQIVLSPNESGTSVNHVPDQVTRETARSTLIDKLVAVCTAEEGT